eukprot:TRINITY_DN4849_c0_g1_i2.p1 TRINITY_DN4849_c0_g1~~TRINITY_DN4849_c0_g1_i2.p1  ORF type:complete len:1742 (+),score=333.04 TRINITY_DN4849_c0_g1_i2:107-5332(+)
MRTRDRVGVRGSSDSDGRSLGRSWWELELELSQLELPTDQSASAFASALSLLGDSDTQGTRHEYQGPTRAQGSCRPARCEPASPRWRRQRPASLTPSVSALGSSLPSPHSTAVSPAQHLPLQRNSRQLTSELSAAAAARQAEDVWIEPLCQRAEVQTPTSSLEFPRQQLLQARSSLSQQACRKKEQSSQLTSDFQALQSWARQQMQLADMCCKQLAEASAKPASLDAAKSQRHGLEGYTCSHPSPSPTPHFVGEQSTLMLRRKQKEAHLDVDGRLQAAEQRLAVLQSSAPAQGGPCLLAPRLQSQSHLCKARREVSAEAIADCPQPGDLAPDLCNRPSQGITRPSQQRTQPQRTCAALDASCEDETACLGPAPKSLAKSSPVKGHLVLPAGFVNAVAEGGAAEQTASAELATSDVEVIAVAEERATEHAASPELVNEVATGRATEQAASAELATSGVEVNTVAEAGATQQTASAELAAAGVEAQAKMEAATGIISRPQNAIDLMASQSTGNQKESPQQRQWKRQVLVEILSATLQQDGKQGTSACRGLADLQQCSFRETCHGSDDPMENQRTVVQEGSQRSASAESKTTGDDAEDLELATMAASPSSCRHADISGSNVLTSFSSPRRSEAGKSLAKQVSFGEALEAERSEKDEEQEVHEGTSEDEEEEKLPSCAHTPKVLPTFACQPKSAIYTRSAENLQHVADLTSDPQRVEEKEEPRQRRPSIFRPHSSSFLHLGLEAHEVATEVTAAVTEVRSQAHRDPEVSASCIRQRPSIHRPRSSTSLPAPEAEAAEHPGTVHHEGVEVDAKPELSSTAAGSQHRVGRAQPQTSSVSLPSCGAPGGPGQFAPAARQFPTRAQDSLGSFLLADAGSLDERRQSTMASFAGEDFLLAGRFGSTLGSGVLSSSHGDLQRHANQLLEKAVARRALDVEVERQCRSQALLEVHGVAEEASKLLSSIASTAQGSSGPDPELTESLPPVVVVAQTPSGLGHAASPERCEEPFRNSEPPSSIKSDLSSGSLALESLQALTQQDQEQPEEEDCKLAPEPNQHVVLIQKVASPKVVPRPPLAITQDPNVVTSPQPKSEKKLRPTASPSGAKLKPSSETESNLVQAALPDSVRSLCSSDQECQIEQAPRSTCSSACRRFAALAITLLRASNLAGQVRTLRAAVHSVQRVHRSYQCRQLRQQLAHGQKIQKLQRNKENLHRAVSEYTLQRDKAARHLADCQESAARSAAQTLEARAVLRARELVRCTVLKVLDHFAAEAILDVETDAQDDAMLTHRSMSDHNAASPQHRGPIGLCRDSTVCSPVLEEEDDDFLPRPRRILRTRSALQLDEVADVVQTDSHQNGSESLLDVDDERPLDPEMPLTRRRSATLLDETEVQTTRPRSATLLDESEVLDPDHGLHRTRSALLKDVPNSHGEDDAYPEGPMPSSQTTELSHLKTWISNAAALKGGAFGSSVSASINSGTMHANSPTAQISLDPSSELWRLLAGVLVTSPTLLAASAPDSLREAVLQKGDKWWSKVANWDAEALEPGELAQVLREGVAVAAIDPAMLASYLGHKDRQVLRGTFLARWLDAWLGPYLESRSEIFGAEPAWDRRIFTKRAPQQQYWRQCGRVVVDAMRNLFGKAMRLTGVEQEAVYRLLEDFANTLCSSSDIRSRLEQAMLPPEERNASDVPNLETSVLLLAYQVLMLNTALHNPNAKGRAASRSDFALQGQAAAGMHIDTCKKIYDLVKASPLGS